MKRGLVAFFITVLFFQLGSAAMGISPAIKRIDFEPGARHELSYHVFSDDPDRDIDLYVVGDFAPYAKLSERKLRGSGGEFLVTLVFPQETPRPGKHGIGVGAKQVTPEEGAIGTAINLQATVDILVPYPGKYAELELQISDGNVDSSLPFQLKVYSRGEEGIYANAGIDVYTDRMEKVQRISFDPAYIEGTQDKIFKKSLDTTRFTPGNYFAEAFVEYGAGRVVANQSFRIGSLFVNATNFTTRIPQGGIQKFIVNIEGKWNGDIEEVYADINISNSSFSHTFRTPSATLHSWEEAVLTGFVETTPFQEGIYTTEIILRYVGQNSSTFGKLEVYTPGTNMFLIVGGIIGALVFLALIISALWFLRRKKA